MHLTRALAAIAIATVTLSACGTGGTSQPAASPAPTTAITLSSTSSAPSPTSSEPAPSAAALDATGYAKTIQSSVKSVTKVVTITEDNDPNNKIGRPGGYVSAATLYDTAATCTELGADCGATIEVWPDEAGAKARSAFILEALKGAGGALGEEYHTVRGPALLRVAGAIKPSVAKQYAAAFTQ